MALNVYRNKQTNKNIMLIRDREKGERDMESTNHNLFEERGEPKRNRTETLVAKGQLCFLLDGTRRSSIGSGKIILMQAF